MKNIKFMYSKIVLLSGLLFMITTGCEREASDDAAFATLPNTPAIFIDGFSGGLEYFPFAGSRLNAFTVDTETKYKGSASMRLDVPNVGDPEGAYAGAIFPDNSGRDLSGYDALTFWAKGTQSGTINEIGFGNDFGANKFMVTKKNLRISTNWRKYSIPIPDASKLTQEKGLFWYSEGPENGAGYTFWIDELKYEKLGTIAQPRPDIFNGEDLNLDTFIGVTLPITGLQQTFNLGTGINETVSPAPSYFDFKSSDPTVASVNELGIITIISEGKAVITATLANVKAKGSATVNVLGNFTFAPIPTRNPSDVISIFSDTYTNVPVDFFNGFWEPFQTTQSTELVIDGNKMLSYTNFNFVGNQFANPTVDATERSNLHVNMYIPGDIPSNLDFLITVRDFGADKADGGGDDTFQQIFFKASDFAPNTWSTLEAPLTLTNKNNIGLIIYENINGSPLKSFYLDNIYFYK
ncbi:Ig-like domain-containing protein [Mariniflexile sp.]|uniref:Ig-like domain-containing protein n=1 Tax=Mariniflexile sp. TaxID=1979402 RepID=UPI004048EA6C